MFDVFSREHFSQLPETTGLFCFFDAKNEAFFAGVAENLKTEVSRISENDSQFFEQINLVEIWQTKENLPREFARLIRQKKPQFNLSIHEQTLYPHLKITNEKFPRLLVTQRILNEQDEYFGAFLPRTGVRIWLYVLNKLFRLRSCQFDIRGGDFQTSCRMFAEKRCQAPCVEEFSDAKKYAEKVDLLRLFLARNEVELQKTLKAKIENLAERLEFEEAGQWRDLLNLIENVFANRKMNLWLDDAVDTFYLDKDFEKTTVHLVTTRGRKTLGFKSFDFLNDENLSDSFILSQVLWQFYQFHAPKEIRLTKDFDGRKFFGESLSCQAGRLVKISLVAEEKYKTAAFSLKRSKLDLELKRLSNLKTTDEIQTELQQIFSLRAKPRFIEAFDVAHISNQDFVAACSVWENGKLQTNKFRFWILDSKNEPQAMAEAVSLRLNETENFPDLILLDGGRSQMKAVKEILKNENLEIIAAVKPNKQHNEISHFLTTSGERIDFEPRPAFEVLRNLRDEAHSLANEIHRQRREIQLLSNEKIENPLLVPIRFDEAGGAAENFRPISTFRLKF
jgi:excinuclease ABC subunit C